MTTNNEFATLYPILYARLHQKVTWVTDQQRSVNSGDLSMIYTDDEHNPTEIVLVINNVIAHKFGEGIDWFEPKEGLFKFTLTKGFFPEMISYDGSVDCIAHNLLLRVRQFGWKG